MAVSPSGANLTPMPSKKQRRRRQKNFRHEYEVVLVDGDGNEIEVDPDERRAEREAKLKQRAAAKPVAGKQKSTRAIREPPLPSWRRAIRRGGLMGGAMLLAFVFLFHNGSLGGRIAIGLVYGVAFVPLTYFIDRTAHRTYQKRLARKNA